MQIKTILTAATCAASLLTFSGTAASAATVLDQSNTANQNVGYNQALAWQQQVIAGVTGTLQQIELNFGSGSGTIDVFVNLGSGWQSDTDDFVTTVTGGAGYFAIDVSGAGISLNSGDAFIIGVRNGNGAGSLVGSIGNTYAAGGLFLAGSPYSQSGFDLNFRTSVDVAPVPLPAGLPLLLLGLGALGAMRKAKKA